jgi:uncharacterized protein
LKISRLRIVRKSSLTAAPWKNGGGITYEAIRMPASGDSFRWRVSVAHIEASGPFSEFARYNRKMVLLSGKGIELRFAGGGQTMLTRLGDLAEFDGAASTYCELLDGPCVDLNLMVCKSEHVKISVEPLRHELPIKPSQRDFTLVFCIQESIALETAAGEVATLGRWDLALLPGCGGSLRPLESNDSSVPPWVFLATLALADEN